MNFSNYGKDFPGFGLSFLGQQRGETMPGIVPASSLPLSGQSFNLDTVQFENNQLFFPDSPKPDSTKSADSKLAAEKSPTAQAPGSAEFQEKVSERLADGMGTLVVDTDRELLGNVKKLVMQKVSMANMIGTSLKNPAAQTKMLMSAFGDIEWYIANVMADFKGVQLPPEIQSFISSMRALQASLMAQIRQITGLKLSDNEMRALLEQEPGKAGQNISLNWLIQQDHQMKPQPEAPKETGNQPNPSADPSSIRANPEKFQAALGSANKKIVAEMQKIIKQVAALLKAAASNPKGSLNQLMAAIALLNRGQTIREVAQALGGFQPANPKDGSFDATSDVFEQLIQQVREMMEQQGLPPHLLATRSAEVQNKP
jgi:hypothetical protein